jgi:UDP-N-acetylmuramyl pentapeptide phosphotransferase/UDP-N-acetylglucosamine-1-phosphate transferase
MILFIILSILAYLGVAAMVSRIWYRAGRREETNLLAQVVNQRIKEQARIVGLFWIIAVPTIIVALFLDFVMGE